MGAWAIDAFGNDSACDWAYTLTQTNNFSLIEETFLTLFDVGTDYLEANEAVEAIAAAETIARLQGNFSEKNDYTQLVDLWVERMNKAPSHGLCKKAHAALDRILTAPSELMELWEESDEFEMWKQSVIDLKSRIHLSNNAPALPSSKPISLLKKIFGW